MKKHRTLIPSLDGLAGVIPGASKPSKQLLSAVATLGLAIVASHAATVSVVAHYSMGETDPAGSLDATTGTDMPLISGVQATGPAAPSAGGSTASVDFNGATRYQLGSATLPGNNSITVPAVIIEAWVNPDLANPGTTGDIIFSNGHGGAGYGVFQAQNGAGTSGFGIFVGGHGGAFWGAHSTVITTGTWYHLGLVGNTTTNQWELYVNGVLGDVLAPGGTNGAAAFTAIGDQGSGGFNFDGKIDDVYFSTYSGTFNSGTDFQGVPEPSALSLLGFGGLALLRRRRK